jgi:hypothetical protein
MTKTWKILKLQYSTDLNGLQNVITKLKWSCVAKQVVNGVEYSAEVYASSELAEPLPETFIDYQSITKEMVIDWLESTLGEAGIIELDARLQWIIDEQVTATKVIVTNPFS